MLRALNEFMGRSTVDPAVRQSFRAGTLEQVLLECGFSARWAQHLSTLSAQDFESYLKQVHSSIAAELEVNATPDHPWPSDGIMRTARHPVDKDEAA